MSEPSINRVVLSLGSNVAEYPVRDAALWLSSLLEDVKVSGFYETPAVNGGPKPYVNAVIAGNTSESAESLNRLLKTYEKVNGRDDAARNDGRVPIDIDIVVWNDEIVRPRDFRQSFFQIGYKQLKSKS